ncbi:hypothetical protein HanRHA438_Chr06g0287111 [Helianthus annuus]|nr:hypothetical protein HanRHA438_Chr06g0287111 [Helianthus annuus]
MQELNDIRALLGLVSLQPGNNRWRWELDTTSLFSVKSIKIRVVVNNSNGSRSTFYLCIPLP